MLAVVTCSDKHNNLKDEASIINQSHLRTDGIVDLQRSEYKIKTSEENKTILQNLGELSLKNFKPGCRNLGTWIGYSGSGDCGALMANDCPAMNISAGNGTTALITSLVTEGGKYKVGELEACVLDAIGLAQRFNTQVKRVRGKSRSRNYH